MAEFDLGCYLKEHLLKKVEHSEGQGMDDCGFRLKNFICATIPSLRLEFQYCPSASILFGIFPFHKFAFHL